MTIDKKAEKKDDDDSLKGAIIKGMKESACKKAKEMTAKLDPIEIIEKEIAGYRDVLATIHENHDFIPLKPTIILQLHRDLYKFSGKTVGGSYKGADNVIAEEDEEGNKRIRFKPVPAWETSAAIDEEIEKIVMTQYNKALEFLKENMSKLHEVAKILFENEKISGDAFRAIMENN